jgi:hypothetical protein
VLTTGRSGVSGRETLRVSAHYFSSPSLSLKRHATYRCITRPAGHLSATCQNIYVILVFSKISILLTLYRPYPAIPGSPPHRNYIQLVVNNQHKGSLVSYISTHEATVYSLPSNRVLTCLGSGLIKFRKWGHRWWAWVWFQASWNSLVNSRL